MTRKVVREERRAQILEGLARCLARKPFHRTTIKDIAKEAGITYGVMHYYFESKNEILLSYVDYRIDKLLADEAAWLSSKHLEKIPEEKLVDEIFGYTRKLMLANKDVVKVLIEIYSIANHDSTVRAKIQHGFSRLENVESAMIKRTGLNQRAASLIARSIISLFIGLGITSIVLQFKDRQTSDIVNFFSNALYRPAGG